MPKVSSETKRAIRDRQLAYVNHILERSGLTPSALAAKAGLASNALTRFLSPDYTGTLSQLSERLLVDFTGLPVPGTGNVQAGRFGFSEGEEFHYADAAGDTGLGQAVRLLLGNRVGATAWHLHSKAIEGVGYLPGDIVIVEQNVAPKPRDAVLAQHFDMRGAAEAVFRIFEPPILTGATFDPNDRPRPLVVDNVAVKIVGVITHLIRAPHHG